MMAIFDAAAEGLKSAEGTQPPDLMAIFGNPAPSQGSKPSEEKKNPEHPEDGQADGHLRSPCEDGHALATFGPGAEDGQASEAPRARARRTRVRPAALALLREAACWTRLANYVFGLGAVDLAATYSKTGDLLREAAALTPKPPRDRWGRKRNA